MCRAALDGAREIVENGTHKNQGNKEKADAPERVDDDADFERAG